MDEVRWNARQFLWLEKPGELRALMAAGEETDGKELYDFDLEPGKQIAGGRNLRADPSKGQFHRVAG